MTLEHSSVTQVGPGDEPGPDRVREERDLRDAAGDKVPPEHPGVVGLDEIAKRYGVKRPTLDMWRYRGVFPPPRWTIGGRPAWRRRDVEAWLKERGR